MECFSSGDPNETILVKRLPPRPIDIIMQHGLSRLLQVENLIVEEAIWVIESDQASALSVPKLCECQSGGFDHWYGPLCGEVKVQTNMEHFSGDWLRGDATEPDHSEMFVR